MAGYRALMAGEFGRMDNSVVYRSPRFAGLNVLAQYSFKKDNASSAYGSNASATTGACAVYTRSVIGPVPAILF